MHVADVLVRMRRQLSCAMAQPPPFSLVSRSSQDLLCFPGYKAKKRDKVQLAPSALCHLLASLRDQKLPPLGQGSCRAPCFPSTSQLGACLRRSSPKDQCCMEGRLRLVFHPGKMLGGLVGLQRSLCTTGTKTLPPWLGWGRGTTAGQGTGARPLHPLLVHQPQHLQRLLCHLPAGLHSGCLRGHLAASLPLRTEDRGAAGGQDWGQRGEAVLGLGPPALCGHGCQHSVGLSLLCGAV